MRASMWKVMGFVPVSMENNKEFMPDLYHQVSSFIEAENLPLTSSEQIFRDAVPDDILTVPAFSGQLRLQSHHLTPVGVGACKRILCALATHFVELDYCPALNDIGRFFGVNVHPPPSR